MSTASAISRSALSDEPVIGRIAAGRSEAPAVAAPDRLPLGHGALRRQMADTVERLASLGIGRGDRVAIVLPNGPEMATAFVSVAAARPPRRSTPPTAPTSSTSTSPTSGRRRSWSAPPRTGQRCRSPTGSASRCSGWSSIPTRRPARFRLERRPPPARLSRRGPATAGDVALLLHTSGTTSRPKLVPLSHSNLAASARNIGATLALGPDDRCLNIMPLFHIHGLVAAVLSSLAAGGSVFCTPGFNALRFFHWLGEAAPTWYTAVPTMHQAILARAPRNAEALAARRAPLHPLLLGLAAAAGDGRAGERLRLPGDRVLRHDRGRAPDGLQPAAARPRGRPAASALAAGPEVAIMAPDGRAAAAGRDGRGRHPRRQRHGRLREQPGGQRAAPSPMAGSAPATRAAWTTTATCASPAG